MRITVELPDGLLDEARDACGFTSKTETVVFALTEVIRRSRVDQLKALVRRIDFEFDPTKVRKLDRAASTR
jgi:Arc/MetJ family transcription regulator